MTDYFALFGIPRSVRVDAEKLEARFHTLQKASHPDKFAGSNAVDLERAQNTSASINEAYRTLRDSLQRLRYLLKLYGYGVESAKAVPQSLLMSVMEAQEAIAELETASGKNAKIEIAARLRLLEDEFNSRLDELENERLLIGSEWDSTEFHQPNSDDLSSRERDILERAVKLLAERAYLETLLSSIRAAGRGEPAIIKH